MNLLAQVDPARLIGTLPVLTLLDNFERADTAEGTLGSAQTGGAWSLLTAAGAPSTYGRITSGRFTSATVGSSANTYAAASLSAVPIIIEAGVSWASNAGAGAAGQAIIDPGQVTLESVIGGTATVLASDKWTWGGFGAVTTVSLVLRGGTLALFISGRAALSAAAPTVSALQGARALFGFVYPAANSRAQVRLEQLRVYKDAALNYPGAAADPASGLLEDQGGGGTAPSILDISATTPLLWVHRTGTKYCLRGIGTWDGTNDWQATILTFDTGKNEGCDFENTSLVTVGTAPSSTVTTGTDVSVGLSSISDDQAPVMLTGHGYVSEGHGSTALFQITKTSHGLVTGDLGKTWVGNSGSINGLYFALFSIVDANTLQFICKAHSGSTSTDTTFTPLASGTLVAQSDGTSTAGGADITSFSSGATAQIFPITKNLSTTFLVDGTTPVAVSDAVVGSYLEVRNTYDIIDIREVYPLAIASVGVSINTAATLRTLPSWFTRDHTQRWYPWGQIALKETFTVYRDGLVFANNSGPIQSAVTTLRTGYANLYLQLPDTGQARNQMASGNSALGASFDFSAPAVFDSLASAAYYPVEGWVDANTPPDFAVLWNSNGALTSTNFAYGSLMGYDPTVGDTATAARKALIPAQTGAFWINNTTRKQYPIVNTLQTVPVGSTWNYYAHRAFFPQNTQGFTSIVPVKTIAGHWLLYLTWTGGAPGKKNVTLPAYLNRLKATLVRGQSSSTCNSLRVADNKIAVNALGASGYMIIKLV
jgi:hypothetical protein